MMTHSYYQIRDDERQGFDECYNKLPCFHDNLSRNEATNILKLYEHSPGTFLIRRSSQKGQLAISIVGQDQNIGHALVTVRATCLYLEEGARFSSVRDLIQFYRNNSLPNATKFNIKVNLRNPVCKENQKKFPESTFDGDALNGSQIYSSPGEHVAVYRERLGIKNWSKF
ncbi:GRB2-related adapter protein-like [Clavelina lepadiformis]|uniref:GRB2-related adapter protein-like n=1 Tax=Clavelina lepadiformis TaxID=159417 RepID=UPI0040415802